MSKTRRNLGGGNALPSLAYPDTLIFLVIIMQA